MFKKWLSCLQVQKRSSANSAKFENKLEQTISSWPDRVWVRAAAEQAEQERLGGALGLVDSGHLWSGDQVWRSDWSGDQGKRVADPSGSRTLLFTFAPLKPT